MYIGITLYKYICTILSHVNIPAKLTPAESFICYFILVFATYVLQLTLKFIPPAYQHIHIPTTKSLYKRI